MSPLHDACRDGDTELVRQLLEEGAPVGETGEDGYTALMNASISTWSGRNQFVIRAMFAKRSAVFFLENLVWRTN